MKVERYDINGGGEISIPIPESYKDCITLIKSDRYRITGKKDSFFSIVLQQLKPFNNSILFWFRLSQYRKGWLWLFCRVMYALISRIYQIDIPASTKIGYGFYIGHHICMVVNGATIIGNNVNLSQFVNIGSSDNLSAIIGDNVWIAPHVSIVDDVNIGNNSSVGAGAVVTKDVPENATVVGVPAKVINYNNPGRYVCNRWPIE